MARCRDSRLPRYMHLQFAIPGVAHKNDLIQEVTQTPLTLRPRIRLVGGYWVTFHFFIIFF
jgi:hypothetical protein